MSTQVGGELEVSANGQVYATGAFRNELNLFDENNVLIESVFTENHPRDIASYLTLSPSAKVLNAHFIKGTAHPRDIRRGDIASSVIAIKNVNGAQYVATGAVLHAAGEVSNSDSNQIFSTSDTTRELSVSLRKMTPKEE